MIEKEIWLPVKGWEGLYEVSNKGRVNSLPRERILNYRSGVKYITREKVLVPYLAKNGYMYVRLHNNGTNKDAKVSILVATSFIENPSGYEDVNHIDGNRENNTLVNLEWCNRRENISHAYKNKGTSRYTGVSWNTKRRLWCAGIHVNKKNYFLGGFNDELEASMAYSNALKKFGLVNKYAQ